MAGKWTPPNLHDLIQDYVSGMSEKAVADRHGVSRNVITRILRENGVERRGSIEANRLLAAARTPEQRKRWAAAANEARRGRRDPLERLLRRAATRQERQHGVSAAERLLAGWLEELGETPVLQRAVGPYNCDLAVGPVAVEIFGGGWHASGSHAARAPKRFRHILDAGWNVVIVWVDSRAWPLTRGAADYVHAFAEQARCDPSLIGQHRVIRGDGKEATVPSPDLDEIARKPSFR